MLTRFTFANKFICIKNSPSWRAFDYLCIFFLKIQRRRIDAKPLAGGFRAVVKHVAEVAATPVAHYFGPYHAVGCIGIHHHILLGYWSIKAGPTGARIKFGIGGE